MKICRQIPVFACFFLLLSSSVLAQPGFKVDIKKPKPYEERELRAEKTGDGKLKPQKRFFQNLTTHFNYFFNANVKLNEVLDRAKSYHKDDYSELLSFYNYSRDVTKGDSIQLDSIIYKSQTGIVMHDLRNDWADDLYLLWGAAYYLWDKLDSAALMFQFINYAFAEKEEDGYYIPVGTIKEGQNALSIATKEKDGLFGRTTSRNNAFLWQIRTLTDLGNFSEAAGLINTLKHDPAFPERLNSFLEEVQAYWFYKQQIWDSSANHLVLAAEGAGSRQEKARWEYLAAQMYEKGGSIEKAKDLYARSIPHTTDPIMDVYARLNLVRLNKANDDNYVEQNIAELLRMAKRDKYADYRDIIYYMAAQMEMERNNLDAAKSLLIKGSKYDNGNMAARNKAFLQIADLSYDQRKYKEAASFYDSIQLQMLTDADRDRIAERKPFLSKIVFNEQVIERQDSLQKIAAMPEAERNVLLEKMAKQIRKQRGIKDEPVSYGRGNSQPVPDLFNNNSAKGEWYFYNTALKTQGQQQFKQTWGNRPNTDNWRRSGNVNQQLMAQNTGSIQTSNAADVLDAAEVSEETLAAHLPLTPEAMKVSNDSVTNALNNLGNIFLKEAEDYLSAIDAWEALRARYPNYEKMDELLFNLYYAYLRAGNLAKAQEIKNLLMRQYASSSYATMVASGKSAAASSSTSPQATRDYEAVYSMFIEGDFDRAIEAKRVADSVYQTNHWQPQLLYIESVYYIQQRQDSVAKTLLQILATQEAGNGMGKKAENLMQVLARRAQIEKELSEYEMQNQPENFRVTPPVVHAPVRNNPVQQQPVVNTPAVATNSNVTKNAQVATPKDTVAVAKKEPQPPAVDTVATQPSTPPEVVVEKPKVDTVVTAITQTKEPLKDTVAVAPPKEVVIAKPEVIAPKTEAPKPVLPQADPNKFYFDPNAQHYAVVVLDKVDPIFVSEARNAFFRFTRENFNNLNLQAEINDVSTATRLVLVGNFNSAQAALEYTDLAKKLAVSEIVPWLKPEKYSFSIITARNLELLKKSGDWSNYKKFTDEHLPGKF